MESIAVVGSGPLTKRTARVVAQLAAAQTAEGAVTEPRAVIVAGPVPHAAMLIRRTLERGEGVLLLEPRLLDGKALHRLAAIAHGLAPFHVARPLLHGHTMQILQARVRQNFAASPPSMLTASIALPPDTTIDGELAVAEEALLLMTSVLGELPETVAVLLPDTDAHDCAVPVAVTARFTCGALALIGLSVADARARIDLEIASADALIQVDLTHPQAPMRLVEAIADGTRLHTFPPLDDSDEREDALIEIIGRFWNSTLAGAEPKIELGVEPMALRLRNALDLACRQPGQPQELDRMCRPDLRVIRGGGHASAAPRPALRFVEASL